MANPESGVWDEWVPESGLEPGVDSIKYGNPQEVP
jgi:hypothetical protein